MILTHLLGYLVYLSVAGHILAGCHGKDANNNSLVPQQSSSKTADDTKLDTNQKKNVKNKRSKRRHRTTEAPKSSSDSSSAETTDSDEESSILSPTNEPQPQNARPITAKPNRIRVTPEGPATSSPSVIPRNENPPPPPPIENFAGELRPNPIMPKFPISPDELLNGKGRLRKLDSKPAKMKRKPKTAINEPEVEPSAVHVE